MARKTSKTEKIMGMETLEDLVKTAEILARPILHATEGKAHVYSGFRLM